MRYTEVEQKYTLPDADALNVRLVELGSTAGEPSRRVDAYYNHPAKDLGPERVVGAGWFGSWSVTLSAVLAGLPANLTGDGSNATIRPPADAAFAMHGDTMRTRMGRLATAGRCQWQAGQCHCQRTGECSRTSICCRPCRIE
ncbi:hypothetical protein C8E97_2159 [Saccharothrix australiensis]|uniref:CYTH domain-containing protein n=1 Tax=Saccharothrix australiensis TaxID=2072 RepID=A0A495VWG8_9PSEU|nr:hypothetical protein C8E97_2159 [Saccharothrix australiensis]